MLKVSKVKMNLKNTDVPREKAKGWSEEALLQQKSKT